MNYKKKICLLAVFLLLIFGMCSCKEKTPDHEHSFIEGECSCGEVDPDYTKPETPVEQDNSPLVNKMEGKIYYTAPNVEYIDTNQNGSYEYPYNIAYAFTLLKPGDTLILKDGRYELQSRIRILETQCGNFASIITVKAENANKAILDFSSMVFNGNNRGIQLDGDYWHFYGLDVCGAGDNGMYIGGSYNVVENCKFYNNRDTGLQLGRSDGSYTDIKQWPSNNLIKNCTSFNNYDDETYGENADGFAAKLTTGEGNVFDGCIAYRNCDDGWDMYAKSDSGNVGLTVIKNCISFENGMTLTPHHEDWRDDTSKMVYTTRDGDGIGFKLGGSQMEGSVLIENCIAYNNKLEGFADNSNPGVISMRNCTAYNNSVQVKEDGSIGPSDGLSRNFDIARKNMGGTNSDSYNNYYGLLSYTTNEIDPAVIYNLDDTFKGSIGYSIMFRSTSNTKYNYFTNFVDGNSYESSKAGQQYDRGLNDNMFAAVEHSFITNDNEDLHSLLRNSDGSINVGNMLKVVDSELLVFCEGKQIGADLNKASWDEYEHFKWSEPVVGKTTENYARVLGAYDVLDVMCNPRAVFQDIKLITICNECKVEWKSNDESLVKISTSEEKSLSGLTNVWGQVYRNRNEDKEVILTAKISFNGASIEKEFKLKIMKDNPSIGIVSGYESKYILEQYDNWTNPKVSISNKTSYANLPLEEGVDYEIEITYKYAENKNASFYDVSDVYTSVPGVYEVTYNVKSLMNENDEIATSFLVYVSSPTAEIDVDINSEISIHVVKEGVNVSSELSSTLGYMYVYTSNDLVVPSSKVKANGQKFEIDDEYISVLVENSNLEGYTVYVVFENKAGTYTSKVYSSVVEIKQIKTQQQFYDMVTGGSSPTTIYQLQNDLDFSNFNWKESNSTSTFGGLFDGNHHKISNITITGSSQKNVNIFYKIKGGSLINCKFENIKLNGDLNKSTRVAIVGQMSNGTIDNVQILNISARSYQSAAGLVGQTTGGVNYISRVSLVNDENQVIEVTGKYCGGIVGNVQKDTSEDILEVYIDNCFVDAVIGGKQDIGGYSGGIVGRCKNEYEVCHLQIQHCVVYGQVSTFKNYAGGILGGCDNGSGSIFISNCNADLTLWYAGTVIDGVGALSVKNGSPIMGRLTLGTGVNRFYNNYAPFADYNDGISDGEDYSFNLGNEYFWKTSLGLDIEKLWTVDLDLGKAYLNYIEE